MKPTLTELWNGNIHPISDADRLVKNERELIDYIDRHLQNLNSTLDKNGKETDEVFSVAVICEGADDVSVRARLTELITSLYGIGANRVSIVKLEKQMKKAE